MRQSLSIEQAKEIKQVDKCPICGADLVESTFSEDGEEIGCRKCSKGCGWFGS